MKTFIHLEMISIVDRLRQTCVTARDLTTIDIDPVTSFIWRYSATQQRHRLNRIPECVSS